MDTLRNQIIERKVIDLILADAKFKDVPYKPETTDSEALDESAGGEEQGNPRGQALGTGHARVPLAAPLVATAKSWHSVNRRTPHGCGTCRKSRAYPSVQSTECGPPRNEDASCIILL